MYKEDLALNNLQWLICHKTNHFFYHLFEFIHIYMKYILSDVLFLSTALLVWFVEYAVCTSEGFGLHFHSSKASCRALMLENGILMAEESMSQLPKWLHDLQHSTLVLTQLDGWLERPNLKNQLVTSSRSPYIIVPTEFF